MLFRSVMAAFVPIGTAADMTNIGTFFAFTLVCIGLIVLRYTRPHLARPFKTPFMPWIPLLGAFSCLGLMWQLPALTWHRFVWWTIAGIIIYGLYGMRHSKVSGQTAENHASSSPANH